ncbi:hypothetical protein FH972_009957 [Carpinus fangiana]|uniref:Protein DETOXIFICATION n=1 Tax=Carpinus fangiana TaxID=176857 RepID=A0A660KNG4_9ROSI|nr:hypothetical protein FH972_009957 [Carpinus fangiana]
MDVDDFWAVLESYGVDVWTFIETMISVAAADYGTELKSWRDGIVERLYAGATSASAIGEQPRCRNCDNVDDLRANNCLDVKAPMEKGGSPGMSLSVEREDGKEMDPYAGLFDNEPKKILEIQKLKTGGGQLVWMCNDVIIYNSHTCTCTIMSTTNEKAAEQQPPPLTHLFFLCLSSLPNPTKHDPEKHIQLVLPTISDIVSESKSLINLAFPMVLTALILYSRSILSMLFLGHLGDLQLAAGSFAIAFANITGYSTLSGLALGMEPLCYQAFGANHPQLLYTPVSPTWVIADRLPSIINDHGHLLDTFLGHLLVKRVPGCRATTSSSNHLFFLCLSSLPNPTKHDPEKHIQLVLPTISDIVSESKSLINLAFPMVLTALILYSCSILSMLFLGHLGDLQLAAGSFAIAFANITGYSTLSGLALGMEPLCYQAFGANHPKLLYVTLHHTVIFLLLSSIPISLLWFNMSKILLYLYQDPSITHMGHCRPTAIHHQ